MTTKRELPIASGAGALTAIIAGQIHLMFDNIQSIGPHVKAGRPRSSPSSYAARPPSGGTLQTVLMSGWSDRYRNCP